MAGPAENLDTADLPKSLLSRHRLHTDFLQLAATQGTLEGLLSGLNTLIGKLSSAASLIYFHRDERNTLVPTTKHPAELADRSLSLLSSLCQVACQKGDLTIQQQAVPLRSFVAAPVPCRGEDPHAAGFIVEGQIAKHDLLLLVQSTVSTLVLWRILQQAHQAETEVIQTAALVELLETSASADSVQTSHKHVVEGLQSLFDCKCVALGIPKRPKTPCRLRAVSGVDRLSERSSLIQIFESAMDESLLRNKATAWPPMTEEDRHGCLAHQNVCTRIDAKQVLTVPVSWNANTFVFLLVDHHGASVDLARYLEAAGPSLLAVVELQRDREGGKVERFVRRVNKSVRDKRTSLVVLLVLAVCALGFLPYPYTVQADCQIEPAERRFIVAPFESRLEEAVVKPGDLVKKGDLLATLDGREIRWERASVVADRDQSVKRRDTAQAARKYAEAQIAKLEIDRLELKLRLLDRRAEQLEIRSPISGIVAEGDLERAQGAPLETGQALFEIAPLDQMIVESAIPDAEISHIFVDQSIEVNLDAYPNRRWVTKLQRLHPRAELRDNQNVFIAEGEIDNALRLLRPGMKGRAQITTKKQPIGWILFHKPWNYIKQYFRW